MLFRSDRHRTRGLVLSSGEIVELSPFALSDDDLEQETEDERAKRLGLLHLLTSIQDEAHRFALRHNEQRRHKRAKRYKLETIPGVGPARRTALLLAFGSTKNIALASMEDLQKVKGIPEEVARAVYSHFNEEDKQGGEKQ